MQANRLWINSSQKLEEGFSIIKPVRKPLAMMPYFLSYSSCDTRKQSVSWIRPYTNYVSQSNGSPSRKPYINPLLLLFLVNQVAKHSGNTRISLDQTFHSYPTSDLLFFLGLFPGEQIFPPTDSSSAAMCNRYNNLTWLPPEQSDAFSTHIQHSRFSNAAEGQQIHRFIKSGKSKQSSFAQGPHQHSTLPAGNHSLTDTSSLKNICYHIPAEGSFWFNFNFNLKNSI